MIRKKHQFIKIWLRVTIPIVFVSVAVMFLILIMTLETIQILNKSRVEYIALEEAMILQQNPDLLQSGELAEALNLDIFHMVAILYDSAGKELARSNIDEYHSKRFSGERLSYMTDEIERMMEDMLQNTASMSAGTDWWGYNYSYGIKGIHSDTGDYLLAYSGVSAPWVEHRGDILMLGICILAFVLLPTTMIAVEFYRIYIKEITLEEYHIRTSNAIAHDLKTPLMAVSGYAENLMENVHTEKRKYYAQAVLNNVGQMNHILETMLQLSNPGSLKGTLKKQEINLLKMTEEVLAQYKDILEARKIKLTVSGEAVITADSSLMRRALDNLVSNAVKYTPPGENIRIRMSALEYEIENTGVSIARRRRRDIWKPFDRADMARNFGGELTESSTGTQTILAGGSGIGLTIVKDILSAHGFRCRLTGDKTKVIIKIRF